jgi:3-hydroxybutyryl-CoA dehydrogenase
MAQIEVVGIVGAGQMGRGIAQVAAQSGCKVIVMDASQSALDAGIARLGQDLGRLVSKGKLSQDLCDQALARISATVATDGLTNCDFVVEAATENVELKLKIFESLDRTIKPSAILASNTSSISLTKLAGVTKRPTQVIGMHFMNPVPLMKLVEIVRALQTASETYDATCDLARRMGKTLVTTKDMPGFIVNRMLIPFINEACFSLQEGLGTVEDIDQGARLGLNHPMGPLELADLIGLDTCLSIAEVLQREFGEDKYRPAAILRNYVAAGWLGRKSGRGFYDYSTK